MPFVRVEGIYPLTKKIDGNLHTDCVTGRFKFMDAGVEHDIPGDFEGVGGGFSY